ncbi:MAG: ACP S-malonyltransferase [Pseudomonadales bacterium]|nr:ACP S-malonyltransferase [Pseudomonadales bacterium]
MGLGFVFPGQGSQSVGMLGDLAAHHPIVAATIEEAGEAIGKPLWRIVAEGPDAELVRTEITQPALLAASVAVWRVWLESGGARPAAVAGHSLGEYSALVCADALGFADAVRLVHRRGQLMQAAVPQGEGAMAAILGLEDAAVEAACAEIAGVVSAANYNAPGQVVIAGAAAAVDLAIERCKALGARRATALPVSGPFHCALMRPAQEAFAADLARVNIAAPSIPVVQNVDARVSASVDEIRDRLLRQISQPVLWTGCVQTMVGLGVARIVECGPGRVLAGLVKRIDKNVDVHSLGSAEGLQAALAAEGVPHE